jgi:hypothetical protein
MATATTTQEITTMKIYTLKNVKVCEWASEETFCFEATLYIDGKSFGRVHNEGRGGAHYYDFRNDDHTLDYLIDALIAQHFVVQDVKKLRNKMAKKYPAYADQIAVYISGDRLTCCFTDEHVTQLLADDPDAVLAPTAVTMNRC